VSDLSQGFLKHVQPPNCIPHEDCVDKHEGLGWEAQETFTSEVHCIGTSRYFFLCKRPWGCVILLSLSLINFFQDGFSLA
jgi:hypothetical protein